MVFGLLERVKARDVAITVTEVDITERPDAVLQYGLRATPAMAINGRLEFVGVPTEREFLARLRERGLSGVEMPALEAAPRGLLGRWRGLFR